MRLNPRKAAPAGWIRSRTSHSTLSRPGKLTQNAFVERFNGRLRYEYLNGMLSTSLAHARAVLAAWCDAYNTVRPHSQKKIRWGVLPPRCRQRALGQAPQHIAIPLPSEP